MSALVLHFYALGKYENYPRVISLFGVLLCYIFMPLINVKCVE